MSEPSVEAQLAGLRFRLGILEDRIETLERQAEEDAPRCDCGTCAAIEADREKRLGVLRKESEQ